MIFNVHVMSNNRSGRRKFLLHNPEYLRLCQLEGEGCTPYLAFLTITEHPLAPLWSGSLLPASVPKWLEDAHFRCCKAHNSEQASGMQQQLLLSMHAASGAAGIPGCLFPCSGNCFCLLILDPQYMGWEQQQWRCGLWSGRGNPVYSVCNSGDKTFP